MGHFLIYFKKAIISTSRKTKEINENNSNFHLSHFWSYSSYKLWGNEDKNKNEEEKEGNPKGIRKNNVSQQNK